MKFGDFSEIGTIWINYVNIVAEVDVMLQWNRQLPREKDSIVGCCNVGFIFRRPPLWTLAVI